MTNVHNSSGLTAAQIEAAPVYGTFRNNWRSRVVTVRAHPTDPEKVITVGEPMLPGGALVICSEDRSYYRTRIDGNDWSDYN